MKFLLVLSFLITTNVFAQIPPMKEILCYEPAEQSGHGELAYFLTEIDIPQGPSFAHLFWPFQLQGQLVQQDGCLVRVNVNPSAGSMGGELREPEILKFCRGEGQRINDLVPVEVEVGHREETVYCHKRIKELLGDI